MSKSEEQNKQAQPAPKVTFIPAKSEDELRVTAATILFSRRN